MKKIYLLALATFIFIATQAQVNTGYAFTQSVATFTPVAPAGISALMGNAWDDDISSTQTIPFTFTFNGVAYTQVRVSVNGFIVFGNTLPSCGSGCAYSSTADDGLYLGGTGTNNGVAGVNMDLREQTYTTVTGTRSTGSPTITGISSFTNLRVGMKISGTGIPGGSIVTAVNVGAGTITMSNNATSNSSAAITPRSGVLITTTGTAPNQAYVIQWVGARRYSSTAGAADNIDFQIRLNQANNVALNQSIDVVFGTVTTTNGSINIAQTGIRSTTADFNSRTTATNWAATTASAANTNGCTFSSAIFPASGLTFTWTPIVPSADDAGITAIAGLSCAGVQNVTVTLKNYGTATLTSANIDWTVNAAAQPTFNWTGSLAQNATTTVVVGTYNFLSATNYTISATTSLPNGASDGNTSNDTYTSGTLQTALSGTYTVGAGGNFTTLTAAVAAANTSGLCGPTVFSLTDASYSAETFPITISTATTSAVNTLTIKPATGISSTITGSAGSNTAIKILSNYVTIDGSNSGGTDRSLAIINTSNTSPNVVTIVSTSTTPVHHVTLKNCTLTNGSNSYSAYSAAIHIGSSALGEGYFNDITISNNFIRKSYFGLFAMATVSGTNGSNMVISNNDLNASGSGNRLAGIGIYVQGINGGSITNNTVANMLNPDDDDYATGIWVASGSSNFTVANNTISNISMTGTGVFYEVDANGIVVSGGANNIIENNKIDNISQTSSDGWAAVGINLLNSATALNCTVRNNFISNIYSYGYSTPYYNGTGIMIQGAGGGYKIHYNSISLVTDQTSASGVPSGIYVNSDVVAAGAIDLRNNIISSTQTTGSNRYAVYSGAANTVFSSIDYNDYYTTGGNLAYIGSNRATLANLVTGFGGNTHSLNVKPNFTSSTDLHLVISTNCPLDGAATPITGSTSDIDGGIRNTIMPDMGADEFNGTSAATGLFLPSATTTGLLPTCTENGWTYYTDPADASKYIFAIEWDPANFGVNASARTKATVNLTVDPALATVNDNSVPFGTWTMNRYWNVSLNGGIMTDAVNVRFFYDIAEKNAVDAAAAAFQGSYGGLLEPPTWFKTKTTTFAGDAAHMNADGVIDAIGLVDVNAVAGATINGVLYAEFHGITSFSGGTYAAGVGPNTPLPVTLNYLRGIKQGGNNSLSWKVTCNTTPRATLVLERSASADANSFAPLYSITADALRCQQPFDYLHVNPAPGMNYYRLKIIDNNGKVTYSNIIALLNAAKGFEVLNIAPNPVTASGQFKLNMTSAESAKMEIAIRDMQGRAVQHTAVNVIAGFNTLDMNVAKLAAGTYTITVTTASGEQQMMRLVKQ